MKRAFTLLELLVVIGIMGLLGTVSIGGYRSITRGMEEKGAVDNASRFIHTAFQRALIDRQPVAVYYWNETIKGETSEDYATVVGKAVAVRRAGRFSRVRGDMLYDEFADLNCTYPTNSVRGAGAKTDTMALYPMDDATDTAFERSLVSSSVTEEYQQEVFLLGEEGEAMPNGMTPPPNDDDILMYGFKVVDGYTGWKNGDAYGFEFQYLTLPHNYIFGDKFSTSITDPVPEQSRGKMVFGGGGGGYSQRSQNLRGTRQIVVSALRPSGTSLRAFQVGKTADPTQEKK